MALRAPHYPPKSDSKYKTKGEHKQLINGVGMLVLNGMGEFLVNCSQLLLYFPNFCSILQKLQNTWEKGEKVGPKLQEIEPRPNFQYFFIWRFYLG